MIVTISPYKRIGKISLFLKDCITGMNDVLAKESVDVIVTSLPGFDINKSYLDTP